MYFADRKLSDLNNGTRLLLLFIGLLLLVGTYYAVQLTLNVLSEKQLEVDQDVFELVKATSPEGKELIFQWISKLGSVPVLATASVLTALYFLFLSPFSKWLALYFAIGMAGISGLTKLAKSLTSRTRPELLGEYHGTTSSFPSGHASAAVVYYGFIIYIIGAIQLGTKWKVAISSVLTLIIVGICIGRVYLGVHYYSDVIAGFFLGCVWLFLCIAGFEITMMCKQKSKERST
ncbi:phosphatase PAP2 family protein [Halobacillus amylolyticus]|uniref:Phosphatase PAP2 family protein n=1 Tax=Halobacillus amylolyticus TaxID=2932259 RepID=A0ABY4H7W6_9BACI|nr:phosphatase PAP2 family protein [Halobacillus amylolyticus]UOR10882.1 phosphatase PAP2 family protein [Halobacillus amylolyticus]